jgi:hypothetical protein
MTVEQGLEAARVSVAFSLGKELICAVICQPCDWLCEMGGPLGSGL